MKSRIATIACLVAWGGFAPAANADFGFFERRSVKSTLYDMCLRTDQTLQGEERKAACSCAVDSVDDDMYNSNASTDAEKQEFVMSSFRKNLYNCMMRYK